MEMTPQHADSDFIMTLMSHSHSLLVQKKMLLCTVLLELNKNLTQVAKELIVQLAEYFCGLLVLYCLVVIIGIIGISPKGMTTVLSCCL